MGSYTILERCQHLNGGVKISRENAGQRLSYMAIDILSIPAMSDEPE
jgi:hypothetical protein